VCIRETFGEDVASAYHLAPAIDDGHLRCDYDMPRSPLKCRVECLEKLFKYACVGEEDE
jgi:hypothetical protein